MAHIGMGDPSYTSKWRCKECGQLYGHNPSECDVCGYTLFRPLPADGAKETFEHGEQTTELGADISELVDEVSDSNDKEDRNSGSTPPQHNVSTENSGKSNTRGLVSRLKDLFGLS